MGALIMAGKVKASTLLEVVVAMIVLMIVVAVCTTIWINVIYGQAISQKMQASVIGNQVLEKTIQAYPEEVITNDTAWMAEKHVDDYDIPGVKQITITLSNRQGRKLWTGRQLIWDSEN